MYLETIVEKLRDWEDDVQQHVSKLLPVNYTTRCKIEWISSIYDNDANVLFINKVIAKKMLKMRRKSPLLAHVQTIVSSVTSKTHTVSRSQRLPPMMQKRPNPAHL